MPSLRFLHAATALLAAAGFACSHLVAGPVCTDTFTRTATGGWASPDMPAGLTYTISGGTASDFSVSSTKGAIKLSSIANRLARVSLPTPLANVEGTLRIAFNGTPTAGYAFAGPAAHVQGGADYYFYRLRHSVGGTVALQIQKIVGGSQTNLGSEVVVGTGYTAGAWYRVRFSAAVLGSETLLAAKAWPDGADEPALWQAETADSTAALQLAGGIGIRAGAQSTYAPLNTFYYFDDLKAWNTAFVPNLTSAIRAAQADDILYFTGTHTAPGYGKSTDTRTQAHGTAAQPIIVRGFGDAVLRGFLRSEGYAISVLHDHWRLDNFSVTRARTGVQVSNADHGLLTNMRTFDTGRIGFKFWNFSQHWEVVACSASEAGMEEHEIGEGFYLGASATAWPVVEGVGQVPDDTGYIVLRDCYTTDTWNDGYDIKEGVHHVKFINCVADFSGAIEPEPTTDTGGSGFNFRGGDHVQLINCSVNDLNNSRPAFRMEFEPAPNGVTYGSDIHFKNVSATNITDAPGLTGASMFFRKDTTAAGFTIYNDYQQTNTTVLFHTSSNGTYTLGNPTNFVELTW